MAGCNGCNTCSVQCSGCSARRNRRNGCYQAVASAVRLCASTQFVVRAVCSCWAAISSDRAGGSRGPVKSILPGSVRGVCRFSTLGCPRAQDLAHPVGQASTAQRLPISSHRYLSATVGCCTGCTCPFSGATEFMFSFNVLHRDTLLHRKISIPRHALSPKRFKPAGLMLR